MCASLYVDARVCVCVYGAINNLNSVVCVHSNWAYDFVTCFPLHRKGSMEKSMKWIVIVSVNNRQKTKMVTRELMNATSVSVCERVAFNDSVRSIYEKKQKRKQIREMCKCILYARERENHKICLDVDTKTYMFLSVIAPMFESSNSTLSK